MQIAKVFGLSVNLVPGDVFELLGDRSLAVDPTLFRVHAEDEEVHKRYDVIPPAECHLRESILAREYHISLEWDIPLELDVSAIFIHILLGDAKVDQVDFVHQLLVLCVISDHDIIWLYITMNVALIVELLEKFDQLDTHRNDALDGEVLLVALEDILDAQAQLLLDDVGLTLEKACGVDFRESRHVLVGEMLHYLKFIIVHIILSVDLNDDPRLAYLVEGEVHLAETSLA